MAVLKNRAGVNTATTGTGTITLGAAIGAAAQINAPAWQTFAAAGVVSGDSVRYLILDSNGAWEYGPGTYTAAGTTLSRAAGAMDGSVAGQKSSTGSLLSLSGSAQVFVTAIAEDFAAGAPGLVLLNTLTASNSATLDDTTSITATYDSYEIEFVNVLPATSLTAILLQFRVSGAFQTANYLSQITGADTAGAGRSENAFTNAIQLSSNNSSFNAIVNPGSGMCGLVRLHRPNSTTINKQVSGTVGWYISTPGMAIAMLAGIYTGSNAAVTGLRFLAASGNIASGIIRIYGRRTS